MQNLQKVTVFLAVVVLLVVGCSNTQSPIQPNMSEATDAHLASPMMSIPADASIVSAHLWVHTPTLDTNIVSVHKITAAWNEATVTWNNFADAYETSEIATATLDDTGYFAFDITSVASDFLNPAADKFGFLLKLSPDDATPEFITGREAGMRPAFIEICYTTVDTSDCQSFTTVADAPIYAAMPDMMYGGMPLMTLGPLGGTDSTFEILLAFDIPVETRYMSIGDYVWMDENADGIQDSAEVGLQDVTVNLYSCGDTLGNVMLGSTITDSNGYYLFDSLAIGPYFVEFVAPLDYLFSPQYATDASYDSDADPQTGRSACFESFSMLAMRTIDAGLYTEAADSSCTYSKGYWKNHAGFGPQEDVASQHLPQSLGSVDVTDAQTAVDYLSQNVYGHPSNGITKLYAQLLAAKLNIANGASSSDVDDVISDADSFLDSNDWTAWDSMGKEEKKDVLGWKDMLNDYNNGIIGPGPCDCNNEIDGSSKSGVNLN